MRLLIFLMLMVSFSTHAHHREAKVPVKELPNVSKSVDWRYNKYYDETGEIGDHNTHDAWTSASGRSLVLSCIVNSAGEKVFRFFIRTDTPIHKFGNYVDVTFEVSGSTYKLGGFVSNVYVGNVHVMLPLEHNELFDKMRSGRRLFVTIPTVSSPRPIRQEFSLMGFNRATLNTITNCAY